MIFSSMDRDWLKTWFTHGQLLNDERFVGAGAVVDRV